MCGVHEALGSLICFTEKLFHPEPGSLNLSPFQMFSAEYCTEMKMYFTMLVGRIVGPFFVSGVKQIEGSYPIRA